MMTTAAAKRDKTKIEKQEVKISNKDRTQVSKLLTLLFGHLDRNKRKDPVLQQYLNMKFQNMDEVINQRV